MLYSEMTKEQLLDEKKALDERYNAFKAKNLKLDMSRGKPCKEQLTFLWTCLIARIMLFTVLITETTAFLTVFRAVKLFLQS